MPYGTPPGLPVQVLLAQGVASHFQIPPDVMVAAEVEQTSGAHQGGQVNTDPNTALACDEGLGDFGEFSPTNTLSNLRERTALVTLRSDMILGLFAL
jgi:hypothetical protein